MSNDFRELIDWGYSIYIRKGKDGYSVIIHNSDGDAKFIGKNQSLKELEKEISDTFFWHRTAISEGE